MLLAETLGPDQFRERVKIYATDVDEDALYTARQAAYQERQLEGVPPELLARYFEHLAGLYCVRKDLRRQVIFGRHDLINDAPISRIDLLTCRNTLMYLHAETQARVLARELCPGRPQAAAIAEKLPRSAAGSIRAARGSGGDA